MLSIRVVPFLFFAGLLWFPTASFAQFLETYQKISFEQYSGDRGTCDLGPWPGGLDEDPPRQSPTPAPSLETEWATFSGGEMVDFAGKLGWSWITPENHMTYVARSGCIGNSATITISFKQPVFGARLLVGTWPGWGYSVTVRDDQGSVMPLDDPSNPMGSGFGWVYPANDIRQVTVEIEEWWSGWFTGVWIDEISFRTRTGIEVVDPMPELQIGNDIVSAPESLATYGYRVSGIVADSASRAVLRLAATRPGERLKLTVLNDQGQPSASAAEDGRLGTIETAATPGQQSVELTAVETTRGPLAFAMYRPPPDFSRAGRDDGAVQRTITLKVESLDYPGVNSTTTLRILRPPVILVHGLWGSPNGWNSFLPVVKDPRFFVKGVTYDFGLAGTVSATIPSYPAKILKNVRANALGFAYNAPWVLAQFEQALSDFRVKKNAAVAQADVIAHSMGGTVSRTLQNLPRFTDSNSFGEGYINKLITIGTPHLGSPLATQLLRDENSCVRDLLARNRNISLSTATVAGTAVNGAVGDLAGDGWGGGMSAALSAIQAGNGHPVPTALIAGVSTPANFSGLDCWLCFAFPIRTFCGDEPLAVNMTPEGWSTLFGQQNDGIVPLTSQVANLSGTEVTGVIHTADLRRLGFAGPSLLEQGSNVPALVVGLLNASTQAAQFRPLP